jgi:hypothetical protein
VHHPATAHAASLSETKSFTYEDNDPNNFQFEESAFPILATTLPPLAFEHVEGASEQRIELDCDHACGHSGDSESTRIHQKGCVNNPENLLDLDAWTTIATPSVSVGSAGAEADAAAAAAAAADTDDTDEGTTTVYQPLSFLDSHHRN